MVRAMSCGLHVLRWQQEKVVLNWVPVTRGLSIYRMTSAKAQSWADLELIRLRGALVAFDQLWLRRLCSRHRSWRRSRLRIVALAAHAALEAVVAGLLAWHAEGRGCGPRGRLRPSSRLKQL